MRSEFSIKLLTVFLVFIILVLFINSRIVNILIIGFNTRNEYDFIMNDFAYGVLSWLI